jgi:hypothetical protein
MGDGVRPGRLDLLDRPAHADGVDARRGGERTDRDRNLVAAARCIDHVGEQERAPLLLVEPALELPAHQRMQLGVLIDGAIDAREQPFCLERGEMGLEIGRWSGRRLSGSARVGAHVEHGLRPQSGLRRQPTICGECNAMASVSGGCTTNRSY